MQDSIPKTLLLLGRPIGRFEEGGFAFPWFTFRITDLSPADHGWMERVTAYLQTMAEFEDSSDAVYDQKSAALFADLHITDDDVALFTKGLQVEFANGVIFVIGPAYFENGFLEWRNGVQTR